MSLRFRGIHSRNPRIIQPPTRNHFPTSARQSSTPTTLPVRGKVRRLSPHHDIRITARRSCELHLCFHSTFAMDDDSMVVPSLLDESDGFAGRHTYLLSSSEGEESDGDLLPGPIEDVDLPVGKERLDGTEGALTVTVHRLATLRGYHSRRGGIQPGALINLVLLSFLSMLILLVDWCSWKIIRQPLQPFYLTRPFLIAFALSASAGWFYIPLLRKLKFYQVIRKEGPSSHASKKGTPTMGGLFFIPIGISVACVIAGFTSVEVCGAATATFAYAAIGFLDDLLSFLKSHNYGLPGFIKFFLQAAVGIGFCFWLDSTNISSPYIMKFLIPLPFPLGLIYIGKLYHGITTFCFVSMGNGVNLTDGLDGLAGGVAALSLSGMCVAVLPICPDLAIFGASMAGTCAGFLCHNKHKASVFMGDTGSLALGGALAAMAACTGMFFPLFVASGIFFIETLSVIIQVVCLRATKFMLGSGKRIFRMAPFHHHLELCGFKEESIVGCSYLVSCVLSVFAGYVGLTSA